MTINIGAQSLSNISKSKELENAANNEDRDQIMTLLNLINSEYIQLKNEINRLLKNSQ